MKYVFIFFILTSSSQLYGQENTTQSKIEHVITNWHRAAAEADFKTYADLMARDVVFIGTDATEYWKGQDFLDFAKPYFDKGKAWTFHTLDRHIYVSKTKHMAWFDELLDTQMGVCRGSGVLIFVDKQWKIQHYVLSVTIPNETVYEVKKINATFNTSFIQNLTKNNSGGK